MKRFHGLSGVLGGVLGAVCLATVLGAGTGCGAPKASYVHTNATLGRVVVYRNGIAYFERYAHVEGDTLRLKVPADKIDDFLKSLTVTDARTGEPAPVSYPTQLPSGETGLIDMEIKLGGPSPHDLKLTYVTEAPSWKPSYRVVLGDDGKLTVEGWAVIDNTSGEDWHDVKLGVGSSSALSFKFDLKSVRVVSRDTLQSEDLFAVAPPTGGSLYGGEGAGGAPVVELSDDKLAQADKKAEESKPVVHPAPKPPPPKVATAVPGSTYGGAYGGGAGAKASGKAKPAADTAYPYPAPAPTMPPAQTTPPSSGPDLDVLAKKLAAQGKSIVVEGYATPEDGDKVAASLERASKVRTQLVKSGIAPDKIVAIGKGLVPGRKGGVRIVEAITKDGVKAAQDEAAELRDPIGTSHFESAAKMTVKRGMSAMVSILKGQTKGEPMYLYDAESPRGNASFPFRAIRLTNPTDSTLESGPVTVFGEGKFIGEGISEPIPPHASAFVPFALDRQIVVERVDGDRDEVARILTVQRGVFSTEVKHTKTTKLIFHNRLPQKARLAIKHTTPKGYELDKKGFTVEKLGGAYVLGVELEPASKKEVVIEESTPVFKTIDLRSPGGMEIVKVYVSSSAVDPALKEKVGVLVKLQQDIGNLEQKVETTREQMAEYRTRVDELHAQIVTLKLVKTAGPLMKDLEKKMQEMSDKLSKATIDLVSAQDQLMMARIRFQDAVAELSLEKKDEKG